MDSVIREGALRLLTAEATCDVVLSCQGQKLMAHKLILSIASPVFQNLLKDDTSVPSVVILPDVNSTVMSLILDYIYTGNVIVYSKTLPEFISVANLFGLHLDQNGLEKYIASPGSESAKSYNEEFKTDVVKKKEEVEKNEDGPEVYSRKNLRKLPSLLPIGAGQSRKDKSRKLCNYVIPSPWCPRIEAVLVDPRTDYLGPTDNQTSPLLRDKIQENDSNNNFQLNSMPRYPNHVPEPLMQMFGREKDPELPLNRGIYPMEYRLLPQRSLFKPSTISSSSSTNTNTFVSSTKETPKIDEIASRLEKQKTLEISSSENLAKTAPKDVPKDKSVEEGATRNLEEMHIKESLSSSNDEDDKGIESSEDGKSKKHKVFKCEDCGKSFSQLRNYKYHRSVHEGTKEFAAKCPECGKVFNDKGYLSSHMKIHRDRKEYACPHCPKRFNQRVAYNMHIRIHTGVKPHECPTCGKSFSRKMLLKQHQRVHTGERPYSCPECGKTFADRSNMSLHARLHTGVKPYACTLCPKSFTKKHHLKTHMNFHTGLKPYTCQKCGLAFSQSSNMRTHYKKCILKNPTNTSDPPGSQPDSSPGVQP